jgi:hypothetical protein
LIFQESLKNRKEEVIEVDEKRQAVSKNGDLWQLGKHRLLCGNAFDLPPLGQNSNSTYAGVAESRPLERPAKGLTLLRLFDAMKPRSEMVSSN